MAGGDIDGGQKDPLQRMANINKIGPLQIKRTNLTHMHNYLFWPPPKKKHFPEIYFPSVLLVPVNKM